jgi:excisionase family DNA binding protein
VSIEGERLVRGPEWLSIHEAAMLMGVSSATLRRWSDAGDIRSFTTPGGHRRFSREAIAGLLPADPATRPTAEQLDETRERLIRAVRRVWHRTTEGAAWSGAIDAQDRETLASLGGDIVDGLFVVLDPNHAGAVGWSRATGRAAAACGELAARRGVGLRQTMEAGLQLQSAIVHEVAAAARRYDLDASTTARWLEAVTSALHRLLGEVMRGHEASTGEVLAAMRHGAEGRPSDDR